MNILLADPTGFCFGVKRAILKLENELSDHGKVYSIGSPIHNPQEVSRLETMGLEVVENVLDIPRGARVFIRAHGESPEVLEKIHMRAEAVIDGTCPFVKTAQEKARKLSEEGYYVLIIGNPDHPEVKGIRGFVRGRSSIVYDVEDIPDVFPDNRIGLVCQTTIRFETLKSVTAEVSHRSRELKLYNTICNATFERQKAIRNLALAVDGIIVIGGRNSSNTSRLYQIARQESLATVWIEHASELDLQWLAGKSSIGIAAGASTPGWLIEELKHKLKKKVVKGDGNDDRRNKRTYGTVNGRTGCFIRDHGGKEHRYW